MIEKRLPRIVLDTNTLVSAALFPRSIPGEAVTKALREGEVLRSEATWLELEEVFQRKKFERYMSGKLRHEYIDAIGSASNLVEAAVRFIFAAIQETTNFSNWLSPAGRIFSSPGMPTCLPCTPSTRPPS